MNRLGHGLRGTAVGVVVWMVVWNALGEGSPAAEVLLKDGRILRGKLGLVAGLADVPQASDPSGPGPLQLILLVDDDLRRTFVSKRQMQPEPVRQDNSGQLEEKFTVGQRTPRAGRAVKSVGPRIRSSPDDGKFDEFGRRIFSFRTLRGRVDVVQGITLITPRWTKVEGINYIWDMRIATSSIDPEMLHKILQRQINPKDIEHRKKIARFYLQSKRYNDARKELEAILEAFPDKPDIKQQLEPTIRSLRQMAAQQLLRELRLRYRAGQHRLVLGKLEAFPSEGVAGEILQAVREMIDEYYTLQTRRSEVLKQIDAELAKLEDAELPEVEYKVIREQIGPIRKEILAELNINTLGRMAAFRQHVDDPELMPAEKLSFAISGWLLGSDAATEKLPVAISLYKVRRFVRQYLNEPVKLNRTRIFGRLGSEEGAVPGLVAGLLAHMKPPVDPPEPVSPEKPGFYKLDVPGLPNQPPVRYLVQLPPEYDPYRRYPAIVTLHSSGTTASHQIDWWAGAWDEKNDRSGNAAQHDNAQHDNAQDDNAQDDNAQHMERFGQATRHGYIVIAPEWGAEHQKEYRYSAREHAAVSNSLRDACRRFAIDTDRVFLSGHSMGGDAAWDLGLAHPDLWAGVIPIVAQSDRYCAFYWKNAKRLPFYVVCGELDGDKLAKNARDLDRYLKRGYNCTVVEYQGRGHEHFYEEILQIFDWMGRFRRDFFPREFSCSTMRRWDDYFWWVELDGLPPRTVVDPADWPPQRATRAMAVTAKILGNNGVNVSAGAGRVTVWLSPEMLDFEQRVNIVVNGRRVHGRDRFVEPDLETLLEDVRTRGDRQHPFWAKFELPTGRVHAARVLGSRHE